MLYAKSTGGFYSPAVHGQKIPSGAVEISDEEYAALLAGQSGGKKITPNADGWPVLADPPSPTATDTIKAQIAEVEASITPRRLREAMLTDEGKAWLADQDAVIDTLRAKL